MNVSTSPTQNEKSAQETTIGDAIAEAATLEILPNGQVDEKYDHNTTTDSNDGKVEDAVTSIPSHRKRIIMFALCTTVFVVSLDTFIMTTALPSITIDFGISDAGFAWIGSAYMLSFAAVIPVWASFSDVFGRKMILGITSGIFFIGTLTGGLSGNAAILITSRAIQGIGAGGLMVVVNICVTELFNERERALQFGVVGAVIAIASATGPPVGGSLTEKLSWRWCFWINVPFTGISFIALMLFLKIQSPNLKFLPGLKAFDWLGSAAIVGGTVMLLLGLQSGASDHGWDSLMVICLLVAGAMSFGVFGFVEWKFATTPLIPLKFLAQRGRIATLAVNVCQALITTACTYFLPLYFQVVLGASPLSSGLYFLPTTLTLALFWLIIGHIVKRTGEYLAIIRVGVCALLLGTGLLIDTKAYLSWPRVILSQIVVATGLGLTYQAPLIAFYAEIDPNDAAAGTSTFQFLKTFSQTVSVILGQVILQGQVRKQSAALSRAGLPAEIVSALAKGDFISSATAVSTLADSQQELIRNTIVAALKNMWTFYTVIALLGVVSSFGISRVKLGR